MMREGLAPEARTRMIGIGVVGEDGPAGEWAAALARLPAVRVQRDGGEAKAGREATAGSERSVGTDSLGDPAAIQAIVVAEAADPFGAARRALLEGRHVLVGGSFSLGAAQVAALQNLAERQRLILAFREDRRYQPAFVFLARMVAGPNPLWPPLYIRLLRVVCPSPGLHLQVESLANAEIASILRLVGATPQAVAAAGCRRRGSGELDAAFISLFFAGGLVAQATVSRAEAIPHGELTLVAEDRTVTIDIDDSDLRAPLRIASGAKGRRLASHLPCPVRRRLDAGRRPSGVSTPDPLGEQARAFVQAVGGSEGDVGNAGLWAQAALTWETARESMALGGGRQPLPPWPSRPEQTKTPSLRVIQGGASGRATIGPRPALTLVRG